MQPDAQGSDVQGSGTARPWSGAWWPSNKDTFQATAGDDAGAAGTGGAGSAPPSSSGAPAGGGLSHGPQRASPQDGAPSRRRVAGGLLAAVLLAGTAGGVAGSAATAALLGRGLLAPRAATAAPPVAPSHQTTIETASLKAIYKQVSPAVVSVQTAAAQRQLQQRLPGTPRFPGLPSVPGAPDVLPRGTGTGFIIDGDGHILTNYHVVAGADRLTVVLLDGTRLQARVVGSDPGNDLALLKADIPAGKGAIAALGDSDAVEPGDPAIAIGTPFGLDHSITAGIISAVNRSFGTAAGRPMRGLIQTDAAINPGNSGGPLLNAAGEVIGITTSIESPVRANVGIGFAIPINQAKRVLPQLKAGQQVQHAWLGIAGVALTPDIASELGLPVPGSVSQGVVVAQVTPDSPAARAGLRGARSDAGESLRGADVILAVDGRAVKDVSDIAGYLDTKSPGDTVTLAIWRDGSRQEVRATLGTWPAPPVQAE